MDTEQAERLARAEHELLAAISAWVDEMPQTAPPEPAVKMAMTLYHAVKHGQAVPA
jgi:hypothetical protein